MDVGDPFPLAQGPWLWAARPPSLKAPSGNRPQREDPAPLVVHHRTGHKVCTEGGISQAHFKDLRLTPAASNG